MYVKMVLFIVRNFMCMLCLVLDKNAFLFLVDGRYLFLSKKNTSDNVSVRRRDGNVYILTSVNI